MTDPITPPPELVQQWVKQWQQTSYKPNDLYIHITATAAQWGADQELEACCEWLDSATDARDIRIARRPKPPSLKEQAQAELDRLIALIPAEGAMAMAEPIRRALEQLND